MAKKTYRSRILEYVDNATLKVRNPDRGTNLTLLAETFAWQEIQTFAKKRLEVLWAKMAIDGIVATDDELRKEEGFRVVTSTDNFSCTVKVDPPRTVTDLDAFIAKISKKYKIEPAVLYDLAEKTKKVTQPVLSKRIVQKAEDKA